MAPEIVHVLNDVGDVGWDPQCCMLKTNKAQCSKDRGFFQMPCCGRAGIATSVTCVQVGPV